MITIPTTLVLGAGASSPYLYPLGYELRRELQQPAYLSELVTVLGHPDWLVDSFCKQFKLSQKMSIDEFLSSRGEDQVSDQYSVKFEEIGKQAIALRLIQRELPENLVEEVKNQDHWYRYLWNVIGRSLDGFENSKLKIITFNYDRSLEYYLLNALQHSFGLNVSDAAEYLKKIQILHVYGSLGGLPELAVGSTSSRDYRAKVNAQNIQIAAKSIRVIAESRDDDDVFSNAFRWLQSSKRICFLGFGFDETNVRRLRISQLSAKSTAGLEMFATTIGMEDAERDRVIDMLRLIKDGRAYAKDSVVNNIRLYSNSLCEKYLRATGALYNPST